MKSEAPVNKVPSTMPRPRSVQILSPLNAGSNLMITVLQSCFEIEDLERAGHTFIWKHNSDASYFDRIERDALTVIMVRNPLSWFLSVKKASYLFRFQKEDGSFFEKHQARKDSKFLERRLVQIGYGKPGNPEHIPLHEKILGDYPNLIQAWNHYYRNYTALREQRPDTTIFVRYEDLIFRPAQTVLWLSEYFPFQEEIDVNNLTSLLHNVMEEPAKKHGRPRNLIQALRVNSASHLKFKYSKADIARIKKEIDTDLVEEFGYNLNLEKSMRSLTSEDIAHLAARIRAAAGKPLPVAVRRLRKLFI